MTVLQFSDNEGDPIALDSALIWLVQVAVQDRQQPDGSLKAYRVTAILTPMGTVVVEEPAEAVIAAWVDATKSDPSPKFLAYPHAKGWEVQYPQLFASPFRPDPVSSWETEPGQKVEGKP